MLERLSGSLSQARPVGKDESIVVSHVRSRMAEIKAVLWAVPSQPVSSSAEARNVCNTVRVLLGEHEELNAVLTKALVADGLSPPVNLAAGTRPLRVDTRLLLLLNAGQA